MCRNERMAARPNTRKVFIKFANPDNLLAIAPKLFVETHTPAQDTVVIFPGSFTDTQATISGAERLYGAGKLQTAVLAGSTSLEVMTEGAAFDIFRSGDTLRISSKARFPILPGQKNSSPWPAPRRIAAIWPVCR